MRKKIKTALLIATLIFFVSINSFNIKAEETDVDAPEENTFYVLTNNSSGLCLNNQHGDTYNGNLINLSPLYPDNINTELWKFTIVGYTDNNLPIVVINSYSNNKVLDIRRYGKTLAPDIGQFSVIWDYDGSETQKFILEYTGNLEFRLLTYTGHYILSPASEASSLTQSILTVNSYTSEIYDYQKFTLCSTDGIPVYFSSIEKRLDDAESLSDNILELSNSYNDSACKDSVYYLNKYIKLYRKLLSNYLKEDATKEEILYYKNEVAPVLSTFSNEQLMKSLNLCSNYNELYEAITELKNIMPNVDDLYNYSLFKIRTFEPELFKLLTTYSDFTVVKHVRSSYLFNQHDYKRFQTAKGNVGCTAVSESCSYSIVHDVLNPPDSPNIGWTSYGATWNTTNAIKCSTLSEYKDVIFNNLSNNTPVIVRLKQNGVSKHTVLIIGYSSNVSSSEHLTFDNLLVYDPWSGKISILNELNYDEFDLSWSIMITKSTP